MKEFNRKIKQAVRGALYEGPKNLFLRQMDKPMKVRWLWFGVTDKCNSRCVHCNIWKMPKTHNLITLDEIKKVFKDPALDSLEAVILSGGEIFLREDLKDILLAIHDNVPKAQVVLSTNGLMPERVLDVVNFAVESGICTGVGVSLDAVGEKHDEIRGIPGNFQKTEFLLKELVKLREKFGNKKLGITIGLTLSDFAIPSFFETKKYADNLGVDLLTQWYSTSAYYENDGQKIDKNQEGIKKIVKTLATTPQKEKWLKYMETGKFQKFKCFALYNFCVLQWDGNVSPCLSMWGQSIGNVKDKTFSEIWNSEEARQMRQKVKKCQGCLNSWGVAWSLTSGFFSNLYFNLKHPVILYKKLTGKFYY